MRKAVLVIEDETYLQTLLATLLNDVGFACVVASGAREAMQKLRNQPFFCIITDIHLTGGSGEEVIEFVRTSRRPEVNKATPILVVSGRVDRDLIQKVATKVNGVFVKPFKPEELIRKLQQLDQVGGPPAATS